MESPNRTAKLEFRCRPLERNMVDTAAQLVGMHRSGFVRTVTVRAAADALRGAAQMGEGAEPIAGAVLT